MNKDLARQIVNLIAALATIAMNILANAVPLNGQNTGAISDRFRVYFVPAGYVFSIWGLIYIGLLAFAIYQVLPAQRTNPWLRRIGYLFVWSCVANIAWLFLWHYNLFTLTLPAMLALLGLLIAIYLRLDIGRRRILGAEKWCVQAPFSLYLGWISVATIANVSDVLYYLNWGGGGISEQAWAVIMLAVGVILTGAMLWRRGDIIYALVILWAFLGIAVEQLSTGLVALAALIACGAVVMMMMARLLQGGQVKVG